MTEKIDILQRVKGISTIPTLPTVIEKITRLLQNPQTSAEEIGRAITTDQALASKVLKLVNSAFYGFPGRISTITHAVVILGFSTVKNIVLTASIFDVFKKKGPGGMIGFDMEQFWFHSVACGAASQALAKYVGCQDREECFVAGLIHDIGKTIMCQYLPQQFIEAVNMCRKENLLLYDTEKRLFGTTHQEVGGLLAENWHLPPPLQEAVKYHHVPAPSRRYSDITAIVHCADIIVRAMDYGNGGDRKIPCVDDGAWNELALEKRGLAPLLESISEEVDKATVFLQV